MSEGLRAEGHWCWGPGGGQSMAGRGHPPQGCRDEVVGRVSFCPHFGTVFRPQGIREARRNGGDRNPASQPQMPPPLDTPHSSLSPEGLAWSRPRPQEAFREGFTCWPARAHSVNEVRRVQTPKAGPTVGGTWFKLGNRMSQP